MQISPNPSTGAVETVTEDLPARRHPVRSTFAFLLAAGLHVGVLLVLLRATPEVQALRAALPVVVRLQPPSRPRTPPPLKPEPAPPASPAQAAPAASGPSAPQRTPHPAPPHLVARPSPAPAPALAVAAAPSPPSTDLTPAELAGAVIAGQGQGGGGAGGAGPGGGGDGGRGPGCDMLGRLRAALRRNAKVQAAAAQVASAPDATPGKPIVVWRGDWVKSAGEEGKGLAGVRQAITLEVAFAPDACKQQPMRGFVVVPLGDGPGTPRLALGAASWRWSDLLFARPGR